MVVQGTSFDHRQYPASNVLILGEKDEDKNVKPYSSNYWLAEREWGKTRGQGFTLKVDDCARMIVGCQIKNLGEGDASDWGATKEFKVFGSKRRTGDWKILVEDKFFDSRNYRASLHIFHFKEPVEIQFLKFELISYWGDWGGGLQYFAAIPATSKESINIIISSDRSSCSYSGDPQGNFFRF